MDHYSILFKSGAMLIDKRESYILLHIAIPPAKQVETSDILCIGLIANPYCDRSLCREGKIVHGHRGRVLRVDHASFFRNFQCHQLAILCASVGPPLRVQPAASAAVITRRAPCPAIQSIDDDGNVGWPVLFIIRRF